MRHITSIERLETIKENGLRVWSLSATIKRESATGDELFEGEGIWLWGDAADEDIIHGFATDNFNIYDGYALLTLDLSGYDLLNDAEYPVGVAYIATEDIPVERIVAVEIFQEG